ncbi:unnamed protein product [Effrenium voratum]|nr:unnamed protein product [Effrenium voratum]
MLNGKEHGKKKEDTGRLVEPSPAAEVSADGNDVPKDAEAGETAEGVAEVELEQPQEPFADSPGSCRGIAIALADAHVPDADQPAATNGSKGAEATGATEAVEAVEAAEATEAAGTAEAAEATEAVEATEAAEAAEAAGAVEATEAAGAVEATEAAAAAEAAEALEDSLAAEAAALQADAASSFAASSPSSASNADFAEPETEGAAERAAESPEQAATAKPEEAETFPTEPTVSTVSDLEKALHRIDEDPAEVQTFQQGAAMVPETWEIAGRDRPPSPDAQMIRLTANDSQELPSETVLLPGESVHEPDLASFFEEVPLMPPASFFDDQELERLKSQAVAEATALLAWLTGAGSSRSLPEQEVFLQQQQEREEEEAEFRSRALRVARRQLWRDRAVRRKHARSPVVSPPAGELRSQLADMYEEKSTLLETIEERRAELANLQKQQQAVRSEIALWSQRVTELEAKAVDARLQAAPQACAGMLRAESMPVLVQSPPVRPNSWLPPWAAMPPPPVHIPAYTAPLQGLSSSPGRVQTVRSFTSPRQAWSPGGSLVLPPGPGHVMSPGSSLSLQPGSMSLPGGMQVRHYGMVRTANSFSAGQLPKAAAMSPSPLGQGGGYRPGLGLSASSPSPSSRAGSPVARAHMVTQVVRGASPRPSPSPLQQR